MVTQDNFRGVVVETWPVDGIKHSLIIPSMGHIYPVSEGVAKGNLGGRLDRSLLKHYVEEAERSLERATLKVSMPIKCDRIERHTAEFHIEAGRDYLRRHPMLKSSTVREVKVFWRVIYLVVGPHRFAISRTNWKETTTYNVTKEREFILAGRVVEPMQSIMRHPYLLPMGTPTNVVFARKAEQAIVPVAESWWPEGVSHSGFVKETNELMRADFTTMPTHKDYDIYATLSTRLGIDNPSTELKEHKTLTGRGKGILKNIEKQYGKPVFATRSAAWRLASRYDTFDKEHKQLTDTWYYCFRTQADGFIPKLASMVAEGVLFSRPGDNSHWMYVAEGGDELTYTTAPTHDYKPSERLDGLVKLIPNHEWRKEVERLNKLIEQQ